MLDVHHVQRIAPHKRKIYSNEKTLYRPHGSPADARALPLRVCCTPESFWSQDFGATKTYRASTSPTRSHGGIERVVSLSRSRPVWTPGRVSTERKGDTRIFVARIARPSITAVSIQGVSGIAQNFSPDTNNAGDEPERIAIAKISSVSNIRNRILRGLELSPAIASSFSSINFQLIFLKFYDIVRSSFSFNSSHLLHSKK